MTVRCGCGLAVREALQVAGVLGSTYRTCANSASAVTPANMVAAMPPISASVVAAFRLFGGLNAGTPLAIASIPVSAVVPEANARSAKNSSASPVRLRVRGLGADAVVGALGDDRRRRRTAGSARSRS